MLSPLNQKQSKTQKPLRKKSTPSEKQKVPWVTLKVNGSVGLTKGSRKQKQR
jgi:hypothetical protein